MNSMPPPPSRCPHLRFLRTSPQRHRLLIAPRPLLLSSQVRRGSPSPISFCRCTVPSPSGDGGAPATRPREG
ncbi:hypothetical protein GW17_00058319 [Ensete ventricosum]|nr:hypothetical protein GW17_00058319 [Ensete ventricosum]